MVSPFRHRTDAQNIYARINHIKGNLHAQIARFEEKRKIPLTQKIIHKAFKKFYKMDVNARVLVLDLDGTLIHQDLDMAYNHPDFWKYPEVKESLIRDLEDGFKDVNPDIKMDSKEMFDAVKQLSKVVQKPDFNLSKLQEALVNISVEQGATRSEKLESDAKKACYKLMETCKATIDDRRTTLKNHSFYEAGIMLPDMEEHLPEIMKGFYNVSTLGIPTLCLAVIITSSTTSRAAEVIDKTPLLQQNFQDNDTQRLYACDRRYDDENNKDEFDGRIKPASYFVEKQLAHDFEVALKKRGIRLQHIDFIGIGDQKHDSTFIGNSLDTNGDFKIGNRTIPATVTGIHISDKVKEKTETPMPYKEDKEGFKDVSLPRGTLITTPEGTGAEVLKDEITKLNIPTSSKATT